MIPFKNVKKNIKGPETKCSNPKSEYNHYKAHGNNKDPQTPGKKNGFQQLRAIEWKRNIQEANNLPTTQMPDLKWDLQIFNFDSNTLKSPKFTYRRERRKYSSY